MATATLDEIRLQQLLSPFQNQNTGVMNTNSALPFINTGQIYQQLQNQNLIDQIIQQNMQKSMGSFINAPQDYYPSNTGGITELAPLQNLGIDSSYGVANEPDVEQVEYLGDRKSSGIARLFDVLRNLPTPMNILRGGLESLQGLNKKIRGTTFALSPTLKDYFQAKKAEKKAAAGADVGVGPGGSGSRRGDADIASRDRGSFRTDDTAGFF